MMRSGAFSDCGMRCGRSHHCDASGGGVIGCSWMLRRPGLEVQEPLHTLLCNRVISLFTSPRER